MRQRSADIFFNTCLHCSIVVTVTTAVQRLSVMEYTTTKGHANACNVQEWLEANGSPATLWIITNKKKFYKWLEAQTSFSFALYFVLHTELWNIYVSSPQGRLKEFICSLADQSRVSAVWEHTGVHRRDVLFSFWATERFKTVLKWL